MTDFVMPFPVTDGDVCFDELWNQFVVSNTIALAERLPAFFPHAQVANTVTETELYRHTIPAGGLGPKGFITTELSAVCQNASGGSVIPTIRCRLGGTSVTGWGPSLATSAHRTPLRVTFRIQNLTAGTQLVTRESAHMVSPGPGGTGNNLTVFGGWDSAAIDTSVENDLIVTVQWGVAHATCVFDLLCAQVTGPVYKE